jgi:hypothetical protein
MVGREAISFIVIITDNLIVLEPIFKWVLSLWLIFGILLLIEVSSPIEVEQFDDLSIGVPILGLEYPRLGFRQPQVKDLYLIPVKQHR